jgi:hypothetical protein
LLAFLLRSRHIRLKVIVIKNYLFQIDEIVNQVDEERTHLATNREIVERVLNVAKALNIRPYTHKETRELLGVA